MNPRRAFPIALALLILFTGCAQKPEPAANPTSNELARYQPVPYVKLKHPDWSKNASIYQINTRQFTPEGTFKAAEQQLPRLKELGVEILNGLQPAGLRGCLKKLLAITNARSDQNSSRLRRNLC
jgi:hypothetical protein